MLSLRKLMALVIMSFGLLSMLPASAAQAAGYPFGTTTQASAVDDEYPDNLSVRLDSTPAACVVSGQGSTGSWRSTITFTNLASNTAVASSHLEGSGAVIPPGDSGSFDITTSGNQPSPVYVGFKFDVPDAPDESVTILVDAPADACGANTGMQPVHCILLNFTDPSVQNADGSYPVPTALKFGVIIDDPDLQVNQATLAVTNPVHSGFETAVQPDSYAYVNMNKAGIWHFEVVLRGKSYNSLPFTQDSYCSLDLTAENAAATPPVVTPPVVSNHPAHKPVVRPSRTHTPQAAASATVTKGSALASAKTLPNTGARTLFTASIGISLVFLGILVMFLVPLRPDPIVEPTLKNMAEALKR